MTRPRGRLFCREAQVTGRGPEGRDAALHFCPPTFFLEAWGLGVGVKSSPNDPLSPMGSHSTYQPLPTPAGGTLTFHSLYRRGNQGQEKSLDKDHQPVRGRDPSGALRLSGPSGQDSWIVPMELRTGSQ